MKQLLVIFALALVALASLNALAAQDMTCSEAIAKADAKGSALVNTAADSTIAVVTCEAEILPYFNASIKKMYFQMKKTCDKSWSARPGASRDETEHAGLFRCLLNSARYLDSLNLSD